MNDLKSRIQSKLYPFENPHPRAHAGEGFLMGDGHGALSSNGASARAVGTTKEAAVLVPCLGLGEPSIVLTVRSHQMPHHAGQVALPGGCPTRGEPFPMATALREAEEEIGLSAQDVELLGYLPPIDTLTGFRITPVVGWVADDAPLVPCDREVQALFQLPLTYVLAPDGYCRHRVSMSVGEQTQDHWVWSLRGHHWPIWGATAAILASLAGLTGISGHEPQD